jgi:hypothetical protein
MDGNSSRRSEFFIRNPTASFLAWTSRALQGASVLHLRFIHLGSSLDGEKLFCADVRALAPAIMDTVAENPYTSIGMLHVDPIDPTPYWDRTMTFHDFSTAAIAELVALTDRIQTAR